VVQNRKQLLVLKTEGQTMMEVVWLMDSLIVERNSVAS